MDSLATGPARQEGIERLNPESFDASSGADNTGYADKNLSGIYVSEITSNDPNGARLVARKYENLILNLDQHGNQITLRGSDNSTKITAVLKGDRVYFEILPTGGKASPRVSGQWAIEGNGVQFTGTWRDAESRSSGNWNLRKRENSGVELYTIETGRDRPYSIRESEKLFDLVFSPSKNQNVVFYIHGRNEVFDTEFDSTMIPYTEASTDTRFVLILWLSWSATTKRPYRQARYSAMGLADFLFAFSEYKSRKPEFVKDRKITLLAYSMGNIPLKVFAEELYQKRALQKGLFDSAILSSADVPVAGHRKWVENIDFSNDIYIIQNRRDLVLSMSDFIDDDAPGGHSPKLGRGFGADTYTHFEDLAQNAKYLDVTRSTSLGHRPFHMSAYPGDANATRLFKLLLNGQGFDASIPAMGLYRIPELSPVFYFFGDPGQVNDTWARATGGQIEDKSAYIESRASQLYSEQDRRPGIVKLHSSGQVFSRTGDWRPAKGVWRTTWWSTNSKLEIIDDTRVTYDYRNGRIFFYSIDERGRWEGYWVEDIGGRGCGNDLKDGSSYWGKVILKFNDDYSAFKGSWDYCGRGEKTRWEGYR